MKSTIAENSEILGGGDGGAGFVEGDELDGVAVEGVLKTGIVRQNSGSKLSSVSVCWKLHIFLSATNCTPFP